MALSVKSGGYGTAGWAINGDIVIDLQILKGVDIEEPRLDGSYIGLRDMLVPWSKGKDKARNHAMTSSSQSSFAPDMVTQSGSRKRERSPDAYIGGLPRNARVADFLVQTHGNSFDLPSPSIRRRIDPNGYFHPSRLPLEATVPELSHVNSSESTKSNDTENSSALGSAPSMDFSPPTSTEGDKQSNPSPDFDVRNTDVDGGHPQPGGVLQDYLPAEAEATYREYRSVEANFSSIEAHTQLARRSHVSNLPSLTLPKVGLRSEDPFGYLSSSTSRPSSSSLSHNPAAYVQPSYQRSMTNPFSLPGPSANSSILHSSASRSNDVSPPLLSQDAASTATTDTYLSSVSGHSSIA